MPGKSVMPGDSCCQCPSTACAQHILGREKGDKNPTNRARNHGEPIVHIFLKFKQESGNRHININAYRKESMEGFCLGVLIRAYAQATDKDWCYLWTSPAWYISSDLP